MGQEAELIQQIPCLPEYKFSIHMHGQISKVQKHLVSGKLLFNDIIIIDYHNGHTDEEMEVVCLVMGPSCFPETLT